MTPEQKAAYQALPTIPARAAFLLNLGVTARVTIENLELVTRAAVGDVMLPITAETEAEAIAAGIAWLNARALETDREFE